MDRGIPTSSKLVSKKIHDRNRQIHLTKLNSVKSSINCRAPPTFAHLKPASKMKNKFRDERLAEIEIENKNLLEKLTVIMKPKEANGSKDNFGKISLNHDYRKRELVKITIENEAFLKRLQEQRPTYTSHNWENDYRKNKNYLKNICEYPVVPNSTKVIRSEENGLEFTREVGTSFNSVRTGTGGGLNNFNTTGGKFNQTLPKLPPVKKQTNEKLQPIDDPTAKKVLYQTKKKIGFGVYLIHIYVHNDLFNIIASNNERSDFKTFTVPRKEGEELVKRFNGNYEELSNWIRFNGTKIVLSQNVEDIENLSHIEETSIDKNEDGAGIVIIERNSKVSPSEDELKSAQQPTAQQPDSAGTHEAIENVQMKLSAVEEVESPDKSQQESKVQEEKGAEKVEEGDQLEKSQTESQTKEAKEESAAIENEEIAQDINEEEEVLSEDIN